MIVATYPKQDIQFNICPDSGAFKIQLPGKVYALPYEDTSELLSLIQAQRQDFREKKRAELPWWKKLFTISVGS